MDNLSFHTKKALTHRFGEEEGGALWDRFTVHYTPVHGSWLNPTELEIGLFSKQCLGKRRLGKIRILRAEARAWKRRTIRNRITINWTFDRKKARKRVNIQVQNKAVIDLAEWGRAQPAAGFSRARRGPVRPGGVRGPD
jgi:DDE superfamily endonuclease